LVQALLYLSHWDVHSGQQSHGLAVLVAQDPQKDVLGGDLVVS